MRNYVQGQATLNLRFYQDKTAVLQQFSRIKIKSSPNACSPSISAFNCRVKRFFYFFAGFSGKETAGKIAFRICWRVSTNTPPDMQIKKNPAKQDSPPAAGRASDILPFRCSAIRAERFLSYGNEVSYTIRKQADAHFEEHPPALFLHL